ncbi:MAG TPA: extracellular solute-binding protein, partial [Terriglobales bacterium]|nr:extracellular solute-binding protein [Terriglobales bacterium]
LMVSSADEPFSEYGLVAESIAIPADRSWVSFRLRSAARFHDGKAVTPEDVIWTFDTLRSKGAPLYRAYYASVEKAVKLDGRTVKFLFKPGENRELPLILGQLPVLPKHYWADKDFEATTLTPPLGSGPYKIASFEAGRSVTYERVKDYWAKDLPVMVGRDNFDVIRYDYYRDDTVALEAFKAGEFDFRAENSAKHWATGYDTPAVQSGQLIKREVPNNRPAGMQAYAYNLRRPLFQDALVRAALAYAFDFEWSNKTLFYGQYRRTRSYFQNSELAATGLPGPAELEILEPYRSRIPPEVFTKEYNPPTTEGGTAFRDNLRTASELLARAGWKIDKNTRKLTHEKTGQVFSFEILLSQPLFERITLPFAKNLERLGIEARVRTVDTAQYQEKVDSHEFDVVVESFLQSLSPGNEQREYWGSKNADLRRSQNSIGIKNEAIDAVIEQLIAAPDRAALVARTKALDRLLQWGFYVIPQWHIPFDRIAFWDKFGQPEITPVQGFQFDTWWLRDGAATK